MIPVAASFGGHDFSEVAYVTGRSNIRFAASSLYDRETAPGSPWIRFAAPRPPGQPLGRKSIPWTPRDVLAASDRCDSASTRVERQVVSENLAHATFQLDEPRVRSGSDCTS
jgi:hypothetical protein